MPKELADILEESVGDSDIDTDSEIELEDNDLIVAMSTDSGSDSDVTTTKWECSELRYSNSVKFLIVTKGHAFLSADDVIDYVI